MCAEHEDFSGVTAMPFVTLNVERTFEQTVARLRECAMNNADDGVWTLIHLPSSHLLELLKRSGV